MGSTICRDPGPRSKLHEDRVLVLIFRRKAAIVLIGNLQRDQITNAALMRVPLDRVPGISACKRIWRTRTPRREQHLKSWRSSVNTPGALVPQAVPTIGATEELAKERTFKKNTWFYDLNHNMRTCIPGLDTTKRTIEGCFQALAFFWLGHIHICRYTCMCTYIYMYIYIYVYAYGRFYKQGGSEMENRVVLGPYLTPLTFGNSCFCTRIALEWL